MRGEGIAGMLPQRVPGRSRRHKYYRVVAAGHRLRQGSPTAVDGGID